MRKATAELIQQAFTSLRKAAADASLVSAEFVDAILEFQTVVQKNNLTLEEALLLAAACDETAPPEYEDIDDVLAVSDVLEDTPERAQLGAAWKELQRACKQKFGWRLNNLELAMRHTNFLLTERQLVEQITIIYGKASQESANPAVRKYK